MGVTHGHDVVRAGGGRGGQDSGEFGAGRCGRAGHIGRVDMVHSAVQGGVDVGTSARIEVELLSELQQHGEVLIQFPHGDVAQGQVHTSDAVERVGAGGGLVPVGGGGEGETLGHVRVGGRLDVDVHVVGLPHPGGALVTRGNCLDDAPVGAMEQSLGLEPWLDAGEAQIDDELDLMVRSREPCGRDGAGGVDPQGSPWRAPRGAHGEGAVVLADCLGEGDGLVGCVPASKCEGLPDGVNRWADTFVQEAACALLGHGGGGVHDLGAFRRAQPLTAPAIVKPPPERRCTRT